MTRPGKAQPICGAPGRQTGEPCDLAAGSGIPGATAGPCRHHGGTLPSVRKATERREAEAGLATAVVRFGRPRPVDPVAAIAEVLAETTGIADLLSRLLAEAGEAEVLGTERGGVLLTRWSELTDKKLRAAKTVIDSRLTVIQGDLAALMGGRLVELIEDVLTDLGHSPDDPEVDAVVRRRLLSVAEPVPLAIAGPRLRPNPPHRPLCPRLQGPSRSRCRSVSADLVQSGTCSSS